MRQQLPRELDRQAAAELYRHLRIEYPGDFTGKAYAPPKSFRDACKLLAKVQQGRIDAIEHAINQLMLSHGLRPEKPADPEPPGFEDASALISEVEALLRAVPADE
jgi:hypothetical protein